MKTCLAAECLLSPRKELPPELQDLALSLCDAHIAYLLTVYRRAAEVAEELGLDGSYIDHIVSCEARALAYPVRGEPHLRVLETRDA